MHSPASFSAFEHPLDVVRAAVDFANNEEPYAVAVITNTAGGAVRAPGAMMAIAANGDAFGYLSGGCIDNDVRLRAQQAIKTNTIETLKYGAGSPFMDIKLPCGGAIDLKVYPNPDTDRLKRFVQQMETGNEASLSFVSDSIQFSDDVQTTMNAIKYRPKLNLRIAGRGSEPIALARIAAAGGITCSIWTPEQNCLDQSLRIDGVSATKLTTPRALPGLEDNCQTAIVLMLHDAEWETELLLQAAKGPAFYIGAVGSRSTHQKRVLALKDEGLDDTAIDKIRGPIGLVPAMRDATSLAYSILAEIVQVFHAEESEAK